MKQRHRVADLVDLLQVVGGDDGGQIPVQHSVHDHALDDDPHGGIQSVKGFVQQQVIRAACQGNDDDSLPLHALGKGAELFLQGQLDVCPELFKGFLGKVRVIGLVEVFQLLQGVAGELNGFIVDEKDPLLGQHIVIGRLTVHQQLAPLRSVDAGDQSQDGGFSGAVGTQQSECSAGGNGQIHPIQHRGGVEFLYQLIEFYHGSVPSLCYGALLSFSVTASIRFFSSSGVTPAFRASRTDSSKSISAYSLISISLMRDMKLPRPERE